VLAPEHARRALTLVTTAAVDTAAKLVTDDLARTQAVLLEAAPEIVAYYADGTAALAADHYDDLREAANPPRLYVAEPIVTLREEKIRTGVAWAAEPLADQDRALTLSRLAEVIQLETARSFRDTITTNTQRDPSAVGWKRVTAGGCKFCRLLAGRGAVYRADTARFAAHPHCGCTAAPVFDGQPSEEASVMQYVASQRKRTPGQQQALRDYLAAMPD
jgi:hypothetical protein